MKIFEKDLFNFIFHPKALRFSKFNFIKNHVNMFRNELYILIKTFEAMEQKFGSHIFLRIKRKISVSEEIKEEADVEY